MNVAPDAASIAVTRLLARSEDAVIRPFVEQVSREPRLRDPETNTYGGLYLWFIWCCPVLSSAGQRGPSCHLVLPCHIW